MPYGVSFDTRGDARVSPPFRGAFWIRRVRRPPEESPTVNREDHEELTPMLRAAGGIARRERITVLGALT